MNVAPAERTSRTAWLLALATVVAMPAAWSQDETAPAGEAPAAEAAAPAAEAAPAEGTPGEAAPADAAAPAEASPQAGETVDTIPVASEEPAGEATRLETMEV